MTIHARQLERTLSAEKEKVRELVETLQGLIICSQGEDYQMADYRARALLSRLKGE